METKDTRGGAREGAGRKSKSEEQLLTEKLKPFEQTAIKALKDALTNPKAQHWAVPLYYGYMYGRPKQQIEANIKSKQDIIFENVSNECKTNN